MISLDHEQLGAIRKAAEKCTGGAKRALHPADPADSEAIGAFLKLSGKCGETHPALHEDMAKLAAHPPEAVEDHELQALDIIDAGRTAGGKTTAQVWHLDRTGSFISGSVVLVLDADSGQPLASGFAHRVGGGLCPAATRGESALPAPERITTIGFYHSQPHHDAPVHFGMIARTDDIGAPSNG
jgi:hypothetical protein